MDNTLRVLEADTGNPLGSVMTHPGKIYAAATNADDRLLVTDCSDGIVRLWRLPGGLEARRVSEGTVGVLDHCPNFKKQVGTVAVQPVPSPSRRGPGGQGAVELGEPAVIFVLERETWVGEFRFPDPC